MPLVQVTMVEGRTVAARHALIKEVSDAVARSLDVPLDRVRVAIYEVSADDWGIGGVPYATVRGVPAAPGPGGRQADPTT